MPRPSKQKERRDQILDAFEACVARYGVEGATLEKIAKEAGLARALIRHNVGNRDELLEALVERFLARSYASIRAMVEGLPEAGKATALVELLFDPQYANPKLVLVAEALIAAGAENPELAGQMRRWTEDFVSEVEKVLRGEFPDIDDDRIQAVAAGITGIYFNVESFSPLGPVTALREASHQAAGILLDSLKA